MNMEKEHYKVLDFLRGMSALLILLFHYTYRYNGKDVIVVDHAQMNWPLQCSWGYAAVVTFFMLSGFLSAKYLYNQKVTSFVFLKNRFFRLYPTYWCAILFTALSLEFLFPQALVSIRDIVINFTMFPTFFGAKQVDGAYWTMAIELLFSFYFAGLLWLRKYNEKLMVFWLFGSIVLSQIQQFPGLSVLSVLTMAKYSSIFIIGILLYKVYVYRNINLKTGGIFSMYY